MDRSNLKQLSIISCVVLLGACASAPPQEEAVSSADEVSPEVVAEEKVIVQQAESKVEEKIQQEVAKVEKVKPVEEVDSTPAVISEPQPVAEAPKQAEVVVPPPVEKKAQPTKPVAEKPKLEIPTDPNTFLVTSAPKDATHPFHGIGDKRGFLVNGVQGKTLVLTRGDEYKFDVNTGVKHDFYFSTSERGWGAGTVTNGIDGQFTYDGTVTVKPNASTPSVMFYQCRNHKNMGGKIHVINEGETVKIDDAVAKSKETKPAFKVTDQQVKQKRAYAKMLMSSGTAKRILESDHAEAKELKAKALDQLAKADALIAENKNVEAMAAVDEALRLVNAASRLAPGADSTPEVDYKAEYETMLSETEGYLKSYKKNAKKSGGKAKLDEKKFDELMGQAKKLASANDHKAAMKPLGAASKMMTDVIQVMLDDVVVVYDKNFATLKEEYEYEFARYESYLELIPIAKEQKQPNAGQLRMMDTYVGKAKKIAGEGAEVANKGDYKLAIQAYQAATDNVRRALMLVGVR